MKTLFPKQKEAHDFFLQCHRRGEHTLDTSHVGTGKTVVAAALAKSLDLPVCVLCPKSVIPSWERELKEAGITPLFITNYEKIRNGRSKWMSKRGKKIMKWNLPEGTLMLFDEIHKCKGPYTQNAQLLISAVRENVHIHGMSATAAEDPTEMRATGYMLGLHGCNQTSLTLRNWFTWMMSNGCTKDQWGAWSLRRRSALLPLRQKMYSRNVKRLTVDDFPDSFKMNRLFVEPIAFDNAAKIKKAYDDLGITPEIIEDFIENGTIENSEFVLVNLLRARQLAEALKAQDMAGIAKDHIEEGNSVVLFVNFRDTASALSEILGCGKIEGGQSAEHRQDLIDKFQADESHVLVVNIAAGGTGISLHDVRGERPRVALISPTFNVKDHLQAMGRIHRNGAKSDAVQKILVASGTVEEAVMKAITEKARNMHALHG